MDLKFQVQAKIARPLAGVFDAVYNPDTLSKYFTTGGASGPLEEGKRVIWRFADYPEDVPVEVKKVVPDELIVYQWDAADSPPAYKTTVEMSFEALDPGGTKVTVIESGWRETQEGLNSSYMNCQGWMNMLACLKAWLEHGVNLREGFF
jgi:uncharacterized protein YndB with AHSA1/START domain